MRRPRIRGHIVLVLLWVGVGVALLLALLGDESARDIVPVLFLWGIIGVVPAYSYRKERGSKDPSEYGLVQYLRDHDWDGYF